MSMPSQGKEAVPISVRPMLEADLADARRIFRVAFGTFLGVPNPEEFWADREYVFTRWRTDPGAALVAETNGAPAGSNFATNWGSFGFFGPLTVRPELWNQRIAQKLLGPTMDLFAAWGVREAGLFTFAQSPKHIGLYQKFGFWPRFLTAVMSKSVIERKASFLSFSLLSEADQEQALRACRELTGSIYEGLDVTPEIWARPCSCGAATRSTRLRFATAAREPRLEKTVVSSNSPLCGPDLAPIRHSSVC